MRFLKALPKLGAALAGLGLTSVVLAEPVTLRLWNIPPKSSTQPNEVARRRVFDAFVRKHPDIQVRALVPLKIQGPAAEGNEFLAVAGGVAPDIFWLYGRKVGDYREQGFLLPLNPFLTRYREKTGNPFRGIDAPDSVWELCADRGQVHAVPFGYYSMALRLRKASLARAGLTGKVPTNWDELYAFARKMTFDPAKEPADQAGTPPQFGLMMYVGINAGWTYHQYVWAAGGEVLTPYLPMGERLVPVPKPLTDYAALGIEISNAQIYDAKVAAQREQLKSQGLPTDYTISDLQWRLTTDESRAMRALHFYRKIIHQPWMRNKGREFDVTPEMLQKGLAIDPVTKDRFDLRDPKVAQRIYWGVTKSNMAAGGPTGIERATVAMEIGTLDETSSSSPLDFDWAPFPTIDGSAPSAFIAGQYMGINAAIQPESAPGRRDVKAIQDAAWRYIEFATGPEAQRIMVDTFVEFGLADMVRPALLKRAGFEDALARIPANRRALWENLESRARAEPYAKGYSHVMTREMSMVLEPIINDKPNRSTGKFARDPQGLMNSVVAHANQSILGRMPESEVRRRSGVGTILFALTVGALIFATRRIVQTMMKSERAASDEGFGVGTNLAKRRLLGWSFLIPAAATILIWSYLPLAKGLTMAFQDYRIIGDSQWVGLRNFVQAVSEPKFWVYMLQTLQYMAMSIGIGFLVPVLLAILLHEVPRGKVLFRVMYYLPAVTTGLVTLFLWRGLLYEPSESGVLNRLILAMNAIPAPAATLLKCMMTFGLAAVAVSGLVSFVLKIGEHTNRRVIATAALAAGALLLWYLSLYVRVGGLPNLASALVGPFQFKAQGFLNDPDLAMLWVLVPTIWAGAGPGCLIYLAALKGIPTEQYEAADLDGAGPWDKALSVTFPNLKALIVINFVGAVIAGFRESGNIFVMTGGGPEDATMTVGLHIWYNAFMFLNFGLATAMAWIMGALLIGFTLKQLQILDKLTFRSTAVESETKGATS